MRVYCPVCRSDANVEQTCVAILSGRDTNRATCQACKVSGMVADWQELEDARSQSQPRRYGIIPCRRCAFFRADNRDAEWMGQCMRRPPTYDQETGASRFLEVAPKRDGCGDGLLREEAARLPEEPKP
jgi:hypothetical protein